MNAKHCVVAIFVIILHVCEIRTQEFEEQGLLSYHRCLLDTDCERTSNNSFCYGNDVDQIGRCKCKEGYEMMSRNRTFFSCLKDAGYGEPCEETVQCQIPLSVNAICDPDEKICRCADFAHRYTDGKCYLSVLLDQYCQSDGNCYMSDDKFGNCVFGRCTCKFDKQIPTADKTSCIDVKDLGEQCDNDDECGLVANAVCRGTCKCANGYVLSKNRELCLRAATKFFEECSEHEQCSEFLIGSICNNDNCMCPEGQHGYGSRCVRTARVGEVCTSSEECIPHPAYDKYITCSDGTCLCQPGYLNETVGCDSVGRVIQNVFMCGILTMLTLIYFV